MPEISDNTIIDDSPLAGDDGSMGDLLMASEDESQGNSQRMLAGQIARLQEIALSLMAGKSVDLVTVRVFLSWFWGSQRRGRFIVSHIREQLEEAGLRTVPDFESTYLDADIAFELDTNPSGTDTVIPSEIAETVDVDDQVEIRVSATTFADPTYRISKLAAANQKPISAKPDSTLTEAVTLMMANDFTQLPVMINEREVKGVISWETIGTRLALGQSPHCVREAMDPHAEISSEASLFTAIPIIVEHGYALVRAGSDKRIVGIITTSDLSLQFQQLSEPFLLLGEIENHIRRIISSKFSANELAALKDPLDSARCIESVSDLTFGEYVRLLETPSKWRTLDLDLDRAVFVQLLDKVRETRNDVMHFDPDGIEDKALAVLRDFVKLLRKLQTIGAT